MWQAAIKKGAEKAAKEAKKINAALTAQANKFNKEKFKKLNRAAQQKDAAKNAASAIDRVSKLMKARVSSNDGMSGPVRITRIRVALALGQNRCQS